VPHEVDLVDVGEQPVGADRQQGGEHRPHGGPAGPFLEIILAKPASLVERDRRLGHDGKRGLLALAALELLGGARLVRLVEP
jgi:hypothetical protein